MEKTTINFKGSNLLKDLISIEAGKMGKKKGEFIIFCILQIVKNYDPVLYNEYKTGSIQIIETPED